MSIQGLCSRHAVSHYARSKASIGAAGSATYTWPTLTASLTGFVQPLGAGESLQAMQAGYEITHVVYFASDPGVTNQDKLLYGTRTFMVNGKATNTDEAGRLWRVDCTELEHNQ